MQLAQHLQNNTIMNAEMIANGLRMEYPDIYTRLISKISAMAPVTDESGDVQRIIRKYCAHQGIDKYCLKISSAHRKRLLAVCILLMQPEKMNGYSQRRLKNGIISGISQYCGCSEGSLKNFVSEVISHYDVYSSFRDEINAVAAKIK